ncbi:MULTISPECIES: hypothetical protein [unclassified Nostoc]|uniref:hypothetical protein n=1 Tax=unclassified Nostoc TaxID=2593658 RepID=UPI002AD20089|nr:hypothetical protein [Nostoc sp. DedQUE03]MDZ7976443.1 hypothetical protein [Nostoc sp. DedQUE03]MDZ8042769.1 hypothetical protein [Nostoc sp. DedQUE02]
MSTKKRNSNLSQKIIAGLLILQTLLIGVQASNRIQQGDSPVEVLIWVANKCLVVLSQVRRLKKEQNEGKHK